MRWIGQITYDEVSYFREDVIIEADNKLGIGTFSPSEKLHVVGDALITGDSLADAFKPAAAGEPIKFKNFGGTERARILDGGNVGIGTTSPEKTLDVFTTTTNDGIRLSTTGTSGDLDVVRIENGNSTTFPVGKLYMYYGTSAHATISALSNSMKLTGGTNTSGHIDFFSGSNEKMRLTNTGLGIGTTSPGVSLDVAGNIKSSAGGAWATSSGGVQLNYASSTGYLTTYYDSNALVLGAGVSQKTGITINGQSHGDGNLISLKVGNAERMRVTAAGNVGIGTTSPGEKLEVAGKAIIRKSGSATAHGDTDLLVTDATAASSTAAIQILGGNAGFSNLQFSDTDSYSQGAIMYGHTDNYMAFKANAAEKMRITSAGKVGIGTTSPSAKLDVVSASATGIEVNTTGGYFAATFTTDYDNVARFLSSDSDSSIVIQDSNSTNNGNKIGVITDDMYFKTTGAEKMRIKSNGNVGIGTSSPAYTLDVAGVINTNSNYRQGGVKILGRESSNTVLEAGGDNDIIFETNNAEKVRVLSSGNVGIGTTSPGTLHGADYGDTPLHVDGGGGRGQLILEGDTLAGIIMSDNGHTANARVFSLQSYNGIFNLKSLNDNGTSGAGLLTMLHSGNVGIGTSSPTQALHLPDSKILALGTGADLQLYHDGSHSHMVNLTGNLRIRNFADDSDITFESDDGSGGVTAYLTLDGSQGFTTVQKKMVFADSISTTFGSGGDMDIKHDGSNSFIQNHTGNLTIKNFTDDGDIIFQSDDGSGGAETYFYLDGSNNFTVSNKYIRFVDNAGVLLGSSTDAQLIHDGTNTVIQNNTGDLFIKNAADDKDIIFQSDDGSGGLETYFFLDGSASSGNPITIFPDLSALYFGTGTDLMIRHDGTDSTIANNGGDLYITQNTNDKDIIFQCDDGSGGAETYFKLDGSANGANPATVFPDNSSLIFGTGNDLYLRHTGTNSEIKNYVGDLIIANNANDKDIIFQSDDGSGGVTTYFQLDGGEGRTVFKQNALWEDSKAIYMGNGADLRLYHNGSNSFIENHLGDLKIINYADDKDIIFQSDDGSGGTTTYLLMDGSNSLQRFYTKVEFGSNASGHDVLFYGATSGTRLSWDTSEDALKFLDSTYLYLGSGSDLKLYHDASNSYINNATGDLIIQNNANDKDIIFQSDDGSGGVETYFFLDGSTGRTIFPDNKELRFGTGSDLNLYHDGSNSYVVNNTGNLLFYNNTDNGDIIFQSDDGSGGTTAYLTLDGGLGWTVASKNIQFSDSIKASFGSSVDMIIQHNGTNSYIENATGNLEIINGQDDGDIIFKSDDGSGGLAEYFRLDGDSATNIFSKDVLLTDNISLKIGSAADLKIYHDGSNSYIKDGGTGNLRIAGQSVDILNPDANEFKARFKDNAEVELYYDNALKLSTTNTGIDVTGEVKGDSLDIDGNADISGNAQLGGTLTVGVDDTGHDVTFFGATSGRYLQWDESSDRLEFRDSVSAVFGNGADLHIQHDGTNSSISNNTGNLTFTQNTDDGDIIFQSDDGSGGVAEYMSLDGSIGYVKFSKPALFLDSVVAGFGGNVDLKLVHDGTNSNITNITGNLNIINYADDKDIIFQSDDGSGGVETYFYLDGSANTSGNPVTLFPDNSLLGFGAGFGDLQLHHDGSNSYIKNRSVGDLIIQQDVDDRDLILKCDDGSGGTTAYITLDGSATKIVVDKDIYATDNVALRVGTSGDFRMLHTGTDSMMVNTNGDLYFNNQANDKDIIFKGMDNSSAITALTLDMSDAGTAIFNHDIKIGDGDVIKIGDSADLYLSHDGANSHIANGVGHLKITQNADDKDIIFNCDDGSGGNTAYLTLDGSAGYTTAQKQIRFADSVEAQFGGIADLTISHDATNSIIANNTGDLQIKNRADDKDIIFECDDGSGGVGEYFRLDGSQSDSGSDYRYTRWQDYSVVALGASNDLQLWHNSTHSKIQNYTGHLYITNTADDKDIIFQSDDGSGGVTPYLTLDGGLGYTTVQKRMKFDDNTELQFGNDVDLQFYHTGGIGILYNNTGDFRFRQNANDKDIVFQCDDGSGGVQTYLTIDGSLEAVTVPDTIYLAAGGGLDLSLRHDGSNSHIQNNTGNLTIKNTSNDSDIIFQSDDGSGGLATYFYLDGSEASSYLWTKFPDNSVISLGTGNDFTFWHDGTNTNFKNHTGDLIFTQNTNDKDIIFQSDDGSGGVETYFYLDGSANTSGNPVTLFPDNSLLGFGAGFGDLQLHHDGSNSYIKNRSVGDLIIQQDVDDRDLILKCDDGSGGVTAYLTLDGSAETVVIDKPLLINGAAIKASPNLYDNIIKLLPSDFVTNDHAGVGKFGIGYVDTAGSSYGMKPTNADTELYTFVSIPQGMKATHVDVFDKYNKGVIVYEAQINATTLTSKGTGNCNTQIDITDVNATATNFLAIQVTTTATSDRVFGGQVTIAAI